ncbi:hypothetical protein CZ794_07970 [Psychrobacter sp. JB385]|nr:hypothetical protein CZ794_07970 [Psychrobacter sp. JB385]
MNGLVDFAGYLKRFDFNVFDTAALFESVYLFTPENFYDYKKALYRSFSCLSDGRVYEPTGHAKTKQACTPRQC